MLTVLRLVVIVGIPLVDEDRGTVVHRLDLGKQFRLAFVRPSSPISRLSDNVKAKFAAAHLPCCAFLHTS